MQELAARPRPFSHNKQLTENPTNMSERSLVDWEQLSMIFGDEEEFDEDMAELFVEFIEDGESRFRSIKSAAFPEQKQEIAKEAHKLKGSASNFGFIEVASQLGLVENNIETITADEYADCLEKAERAFSVSQQEVANRYPSLAAR